MKAKFLFPGIISVLAVACHTPSTPPNPNAAANSDSMRQDKTRVYVDTTEQTTFKQQEEDLIKKNNEEIAKLKEKIRREKGRASEKYNTELDTLNRENGRMETRLDKIGHQSKADWETFKYDFNKDMDTIGKSISRFAERNMSNDKSNQ